MGIIRSLTTGPPRALVAVGLAAALAAPVAASAEETGEETTTTTTTTTSAPTTTTTAVAPPTEPAPEPGPEPVREPDPAPTSEQPAPAVDDGIAEPPPEGEFVVPPPTQPQSVTTRQIRRVVTRQLLAARDTATALEQARLAAEARVVDLESLLGRLAASQTRLSDQKRRAITRLASSRHQMRMQAADAFVRGPFGQLDALLRSEGPNDFARRWTLVRASIDAEQAAIDEYRAAKEAATSGLERLARELEQAGHDLETARQQLVAATTDAQAAMERVMILEAGSRVAVNGFVFPVGHPHTFVDTFLAPRMPGTPYEHLHQGTDIFAPSGTPLFACERGIVTRVGTDLLGGTKLWIVGASGNRYYYAHLSGYVEGIHDGMAVEAGQHIGFVGNTGNAVGTPAHLHFEIHPPRMPAVNPYPILKVIDDAARAGQR